MNTNRIKRASETLKGLLKKTSGDNDDYLTIDEIIEGLHERGFGLLMLLFALPLSIPLPVPPGYTTVLGFPLLVFSTQMVLGKSVPWIPKFLGKKKISRSILTGFIEKTSPVLLALEKIMKPRLIQISQGMFMERVCGMICLVLSISIALPLPLTNFIPAGGIALIALGLMSRDGLFIILGTLVGIVGVVITILVISFGVAAVERMFDFFVKLIL